MSETVLRRVRRQQGQVHTALIAVAALGLGVSLLPQGARAANSVASTQALVLQAESAANTIAVRHGGSYARVGVINLRKTGLVNDVASTSRPYVSAASGTARTYRIVFTRGKHRYALVRSAAGAVSLS